MGADNRKSSSHVLQHQKFGLLFQHAKLPIAMPQFTICDMSEPFSLKTPVVSHFCIWRSARSVQIGLKTRVLPVVLESLAWISFHKDVFESFIFCAM